MTTLHRNKSRDDEPYIPDWFEKQLQGLHPDARAAFVRIHGQCWDEGCHGSEYGARFKELLDLEIFGKTPADRDIASAERMAGPPPGIHVVYSDGTTKFVSDADNWGRCYPSQFNRDHAA